MRELPQGGYCLIAGERRWRACRLLGWSRIPALVWEKDEPDAAVLTLAENLHRSDLHYLEEAEGILQPISRCGMTQNDAAALLAISPSALCNKLRLLRLSPAVQQAVTESRLPERLARGLLTLPDEDLQLRAVRHLSENGLNVRQGEEYLAQLLRRGQHPPYRGLLRDYRILFSTVDRAVEEIRRFGVAVTTRRKEEEDCISYTIRIPKSAKKQPDETDQLSLYACSSH